ncbi:5-(carboxyamino)imidazole ribonucleotide synthase [Ectothiorhodospiraceae bacterium BW-2]|nr:5-(carboxyamino)imidazole ribonucleotide synthase [Ectothiorhodospiraceae bacterium BW-2]
MHIGIIGGGQLARMLALAGYPLGLSFTFLDPSQEACAAPLGRHLCTAYDDPKGLQQLAKLCDLITYEFESIPTASLNYLAKQLPVYPPPAALAVAQDRLHEKELFRHLGIATAPFVAINTLKELQQALDSVGYPAILKTRTQGYDGKGQVRINRSDDLQPAWEQLRGVPALVEAAIPFDRELSIIAVRDRHGSLITYPLSENEHHHGILHRAFARPDDAMSEQAAKCATSLLQALNYTGTLALELFESQGRLLANEFAPRVHNSGHWTIEATPTSQFENHLRAITHLPLGATATQCHAAMVNFIGQIPPHRQLLQLPDLHLHDYGKQSRPGRKVGHATLCSHSRTLLEQQLQQLQHQIDSHSSEEVT